MSLKNKTAVITGCSRGIGKSILEVFSEQKINVFACVRSIDNDFNLFTNNLAKKHGNEIIPIILDLNNEDSIREAAQNILSSNKGIDILVNNAATIYTGIFQMTSNKQLRSIFDTNFFSQTVFTQYILKSMMKKKSGSIIYISSTSALDGNDGRSAYSSTKAAIIAQAKALSRETGAQNIRVNVVAPGLTNTDMMNNNTRPEIIKDVISNSSLKRLGEPNEIAKTVLFLSSDDSSYITGQVIRVDGGM